MTRQPLPTALFLALLPLALLSPAVRAAAKSSPPEGKAVSVGRAVSAVTLPDTAGRKHNLGDMKQPVTLLFFCGCTPCHDFARLWSQVQQTGDLTFQAPARAPAAHSPATIVVFLGGATNARAFAAQTGLDPSETLLLLDPSDQAGQKFGVIQCPRIFVVDVGRRLVYTNPDADTPVPSLSATALVSRTLTAWHHLTGAEKVAPKKKVAP